MTRPLRAVPPADDGIVWEEPTPSNRGGQPAGKWVVLLAPLARCPGKWALIGVKSTGPVASTAASNLRRGTIQIPPGRWEFVGRSLPDGSGAVYARYLGPEGETS